MSRVVKCNDPQRVEEFIKQKGYVAIIYTRESDWPSQIFAEKCAEYSRDFPFVTFVVVVVRPEDTILVSRAPLAFVPTTVFFRNGISRGQVVGTDYASMERSLAAMRADGYSLVPAVQDKTSVYHPQEESSFRSTRTMSAVAQVRHGGSVPTTIACEESSSAPSACFIRPKKW